MNLESEINIWSLKAAHFMHISLIATCYFLTNPWHTNFNSQSYKLFWVKKLTGPLSRIISSDRFHIFSWWWWKLLLLCCSERHWVEKNKPIYFNQKVYPDDVLGLTSWWTLAVMEAVKLKKEVFQLGWPRGLLKQQTGTERQERLQPQGSLKQKQVW